MTLTVPTPAEVHLWRIALDAARRDDPRWSLSEEERSRAARFHFAADRERWAVGRGLLRQVLGSYLGVPPPDVRFEVGPFGKLSLGAHPLRFNVSHSGSFALLAFAWDREVGIDVERLRADFAPEELAAPVFSAEEQESLCALPPGARHRAFLTLWTGKEAYAKARGLGLSFPLAGLTLRPQPDTEEIILEDRTDTADWPCLSLRRLTLDSDHLGALAVEGPPPDIHRFDLLC